MRNERAFLDGNRWQSVGFEDSDEYSEDLNQLTNVQLERAINTAALSIIRYSSSEWSNDYFDAVSRMADLWAEVSGRFPK